MGRERREIRIQRDYYAATANQYDKLHSEEDEEHGLALSFMCSMIHHYGIHSILDVGSGTGRVLRYLNASSPETRVVGIEPVTELRDVGHRGGIADDQLIDGDATALPFADGAFDLVCEFATLHHIPNPDAALGEMIRVANKAIFLMDSNNFGQGSWPLRTSKQVLRALGLWNLADFVKTRGRGYTLTSGDGLAYSYSVFQNFRQMRQHCDPIHVLNPNGNGMNPYRCASAVAVLGIKRTS